jgi:hypothetical protein
MKNPVLQSRSIQKTVLALALGSAGLLAAGQADAGCGMPEIMAPPAAGRDEAPAMLMRAVYRPATGGFIRVSDQDDGSATASIVGTWRFTFVSDGTAYPQPIPYGATVDFGTQQWHGDHTEFTISGGRAPSTGDVCMGQWKQVGERTYKLNHLALAYVSSDTPPPVGPVVPAAYLGPAIITETVTVSRDGNKMQGHFTIDQYAKDEVTLLEHIAGSVAGTRLTVD